jgi:CubicO group peptidase (beta-lactamase class C family)
MPGRVGAAEKSEVAKAHDALDRTMPETLARFHIPAVSIARIRSGRVDLVAAYGLRDGAHPATAATLFNVASLTKPLAAQTVLRLASEGRFLLDEPLSKTWADPDVRDDPRAALLTPRIMLSHQTGFANWRHQTGGKLGFAFTPGKGYGYSGEGYEYLRHWLRARTGKALDVEAQAQVFTPAGMTETAFTAQRWFKGRLAHPAVDGGFIPPTLPDEPSAADNVHTTARDYARFLVWLMGSGGLTPDLAAEQRTIQASQGDELCNKAMPAHCPESAGFGLGWQVIHLGAKTFLMHTGNDAGEFSFAYWSPDTREGAVILTNGNRGAEAVLAAIDLLGFDPDYAAFLKALAAK